MSSVTSADNAKAHEDLKNRILQVFSEFGNGRWITRAYLSRRNGTLDKIGIDAVTEFKIDKTRPGFFSFQIKTRKSHVSLHKKKYPAIPAIVFSVDDSLGTIRKKYITFLFVYSAFNKGKEQDIMRKFQHLRMVTSRLKELKKTLNEYEDILTIK
ncbi:hypothetical protein KKA27_00480 [Patescibacteria group bacterium]|nr:hypothetical protein [Patescibacteria group bacterium]MBU2633488.1 hypothetical protein [Patescibacteria group bacterium]